MIELETPDGNRLLLRPGVAQDPCDGCGAPGGGRGGTPSGRLIVERVEGCSTTMRLRLCGGCVAESMAIMLGRRHVQAGGSIEDIADPSLADPGDESRAATAPADASSAATSDPSPDAGTGRRMTQAPAAPGEDKRGWCPSCEAPPDSVVLHGNGLRECDRCETTWHGRRVPIDTVLPVD